MSNPLAGIEPAELWKYFHEITRIPRESKNEAGIRNYLADWAKKNRCTHTIDEAGNIIIKAPATAGHEKAPTVVLQGHMDMVCEKNADVKFDFAKDPLDVFVEDDFVKARGTTLGSDNGIGIAAAQAAVTDPQVVHGPLELLFTVDEETGLTGATRLQGGTLEGRILLNMDSEEDGTLYVGCAGGGDDHLTLTVKRVKPPARKKAYQLKVVGLKGGHSGLNIIENRGNAVRIASQFLRRAIDTVRGKVYVCSIDGGEKHNAIPREASAVFYASNRAGASLRRLAKAMKKDALAEFKTIDPDIDILIEDTLAEPKDIIHKKDANRLVDLLIGLPHGVDTMSRDIAGLVETSNNLAAVKTEGEKISILTSSRSSVMPALENIRSQIRACGRLAGAEVEEGGGYPAWQPDMKSKLLKLTKQTYREEFGNDPEVKAIHAGLECGIIGDKFEGMEMISFGPNIFGAHSPDERVQISTTQNFYKLFKAVLRKLA
jgi:dipeptidase D